MPPPGVKANFTLLQLTALLFGMPAIVAYAIGYDAGACIYGTLYFCSTFSKLSLTLLPQVPMPLFRSWCTAQIVNRKTTT